MKKKDLINDPNSCLNKCLEDQETFLLIESDPMMPLTVMIWAMLRVQFRHNKKDDECIKEATRLALNLHAKNIVGLMDLDIVLGKDKVTDIRQGLKNILCSLVEDDKIADMFPDEHTPDVIRSEDNIIDTISMLKNASSEGIVSLVGNIRKREDGTLYWAQRFDKEVNSTKVDINDLSSQEFWEATKFSNIEEYYYFLYEGELYCKKNNAEAYKVSKISLAKVINKDATCSIAAPAFKSLNGCVYHHQWDEGKPQLYKWRPDTLLFYGVWEKSDDQLNNVLMPCAEPIRLWNNISNGSDVTVEGTFQRKAHGNVFEIIKRHRQR